MARTKHGLPGIYNASPITLSDGQGSALATNSSGQLIAAAPSGSSSNQVQGTAADNAAAVGNPVQVGGVYTTATPTYDNGDVARFRVDVNGRQLVSTAPLSSSTDSVTAVGDVAHDAADSGNPVKIGGFGSTTAPTAVTANDRVNAWLDLNGRQMVGSGNATGAAMPANVFPVGISDGTNLINLRTNIGGDGYASNVALSTMFGTFNGSTYDRARSLTNGTNSTGTGILATGMVAQLDDTSPTSITENQFGNVRMSADRSLLVAERSATGTQTSVAGSASSVTLLAANSARKGATITNDSSAVLYIKLGATASTSSYTVTVAGSASAPFSYYEVPFGYAGVIDGIWASATGNARVTEMT